MLKTLRRSIFLLTASAAIFFACSKKDDGIVTFKVDKTTSTTGAYNGDKQIGTGSTTAVTGIAGASTGATTATTATTSSTSSTSDNNEVVNPPCSPTANSMSLSNGTNMSIYVTYFYSGGDMTASSTEGDIDINFPGVPVSDHIYNTSGQGQYYAGVRIHDTNGNTWNSDDDQSLYVKVDKNTGNVSATLCGMKFTGRNDYTLNYSHITVSGNLTGK